MSARNKRRGSLGGVARAHGEAADLFGIRNGPGSVCVRVPEHHKFVLGAFAGQARVLGDADIGLTLDLPIIRKLVGVGAPATTGTLLERVIDAEATDDLTSAAISLAY